IDNPTTLDGRMRRVEFPELSNAVKKRVPFSVEQSNAINRIQEDGNFVAHLSSHRAKDIQLYSDELMKVQHQLSKSNASSDERTKAFNKTFDKMSEKFMLWVSPAQALNDLRDTSSILLTLFNAMPEPPQARSTSQQNSG